MRLESQPILIGLCSNIEPERHIPAAMQALRQAFSEVQASTLHRTRPLAGRDQPAYINGVVCAKTALPPEGVRTILRQIEDQCGRHRDPIDKYASRTMDLDLLAYGSVADPERGLPNPELLTRDFVLVPAAELWPDWRHPVEGKPLHSLARELFPEQPNFLGEVHLTETSVKPRHSRVTAICAVSIFLLTLLVAGLVSAGTTPWATSAAMAAATPGAVPAPGVDTPAPARPPRPLAWRLFWSLVRIGLAVWIGLALYMFVFQAQFVYFPTKGLDGTPARIDLAFEDVRLPTSDGEQIHAWFVPCPESNRGTVLFCHGNGGNISHRLDNLLILHRMGFAVLLFDYRGYGQSTGRPSEKGTYTDAQAAWDSLTRQRGIPPGSIVVYGQSLGGPVAAWLAARTNPAALVLDSTFTSLADEGGDVYPYLPVRILCRFRYATAQHLKSVPCPVVVIHSPEDEIVRFRHGQTLFRLAPGPKQFVEITGSHNEGFLSSGEKYSRGLDEALRAVMRPPQEPHPERQQPTE